MSNTIICIDKRFAVKNSGISCLALISNLSNLTILQARNQFLVAKYDGSYTVIFDRLIQTHGLVVKLSHSQWGNTGSNPAGCRILRLSSTLGHLALCWAWQCTDIRTFILLLSLYFALSRISSVAISRWKRFTHTFAFIDSKKGMYSAKEIGFACLGLGHTRIYTQTHVLTP